MRTLLKLSLWLILLSPLAAALLFWLTLSPAPLVSEHPPLSHQDLLQARRLLHQHQQQAGSQEDRRELVFTARDLEMAARLLLQRHFESGVRVTIEEDRLRAEASLRIPGLPSRPWLNLALTLQTPQRHPVLVRMQAGPFTIPQPIARGLLARLLERAAHRPEYRVARSLIDTLWLEDGRLHLRYRWSPELATHAYDVLSDADRDLNAIYIAQLRQQTSDASLEKRLVQVLPPLFALARERTQANGDAVSENRALLGVLAAWARPGEAAPLLGLPPARRLPPFRARLRGRIDLARHFLISALLAVRGNDALANTAGVYKEVDDAVGGSGFSFADLAADRAGSRFGALAVHPDTAFALQTLIATGITEDDLMPPIDALAEGLPLDRIQRDYHDLNSPRYRAAIRLIDHRIATLRLYRTLTTP